MDGIRSAFQCPAAEGAVLTLPKGATIYEARNILDFQQFAARHAVNWYRYMFDKGRDDPNGSLYFVTECTKSINWGTAVFYPHPTTSDYLRLTFDQGSCQWDCQGKVDARTGPKAKDIIVSDEEEPNQCVFLRGYKIMLRQNVWEKLKSAVMIVPSQDGGFSLPSTGTSSHSSGHGMSGNQSDSSHTSGNNSYNAQDPGHSTRFQDIPLINRYDF